MNVMDLMRSGRNGDTLIAHISPKEAAVLKSMGGSGSRNPKTGLLEFWSDSGDGGFGGSESGMGTGDDGGYGGGFGGDDGGWGGGWGGDEGGMSVGGFDGGDFGGPSGPSDGAADNGTLSDLSDYADMDLGATQPGYNDYGNFTGIMDDVTFTDVLNGVADVGKSALAGVAGGKAGSMALGGLFGSVNPALGIIGALLGGTLGSQFGKSIANADLGPTDPGFSFNDTTGTGGEGISPGGGNSGGIASSTMASISPSASASKAFMYPLAQKAYPWSYNAARGTGGGSLARLMR